jgi:hypothetical protein
MSRENAAIYRLAETMAVEASLADSKRMKGAVDVVVDGRHMARFEYQSHGDVLHVDTLQGHFEV